MALPASDNFNRANGSLTAGSNWDSAIGDFAIDTNAVHGDAAGQHIVFWVADAFSNDHWSQATIVTVGSALCVAVRVTTAGGGNAYVVSATLTALTLYKFVAGTPTLIHEHLVTVNNGDVIKLEVTGTTLKVYQNAGLVDTQTDADLATGSAGLYAFSTDGSLDNWSADNVGGGGALPFITTLVAQKLGY